MAEQPRLYTDLAGWFHLLTRPEEYQEEAAQFRESINQALPGARTMLELGSGGGNNASHLKKHFDLTLTDLSSEMLAISKQLNPELPHYQGDMRMVRLGRVYDVVFVHDAVSYLTTESDLRQAMETAFVHTRPGGIALFVPDCVKETFVAGCEINGHDSSDGYLTRYAGMSLRALECTYDPDPDDTTYIVDFAYLLRDGADTVRCVHDRHINGVFPRDTWLRLLGEVGYQATVVPLILTDVSPGDWEMFLGKKNAS